jgi:hypothetical protein
VSKAERFSEHRRNSACDFSAERYTRIDNSSDIGYGHKQKEKKKKYNYKYLVRSTTSRISITLSKKASFVLTGKLSMRAYRSLATLSGLAQARSRPRDILG